MADATPDTPPDDVVDLDLLARWNDEAEDLLRTNPSLGIEKARRAIEAAQRHGITKSIPRSRFILGIAHSFLTQFEICRETLELAAEEATAAGQLALANRCMNGLATIYERMGQFGRSFQMLHKCLAIGREMGDNAAQVRALSNLGNVYAALQDHDKAAEIFEDALTIARNLDDGFLGMIAAASYAESQTAAGHLQRAEELITPCVAMAEREGHGLHLGFIYKIRAETLLAKGERVAAAEDLARAEKVARELLERDLLCDVLITQGQLALEDGDVPRAQAIAAEVVPLAITVGIRLYERRAAGFEAALALATNDYERACDALKRELAVERALAADMTSRKTQILTVEYEVEQHRIVATTERDRSAQLDTANRRLQQALEQLEHTASHDPLTGLLNRGKFKELADAALRDAAQKGERAALSFLDLDEFKEVNDRLGHDAGDKLLIEFARRLKRSVRGCDLVARLGGDEFVVLLRELDGETELGRVMAGVRQALAEPFWLGTNWSVHASVGTAIFPDDGTGLEDLQKRADRLMYQEKRAGFGRSDAA